MGKKYHWTYANKSWASYGTMRCTACGKQVTEGDYRVRETEEAYLVQHRACCENDPYWAKLDKEIIEQYESMKLRLAAFREFKKQWNVDIEEFDDEIASMQSCVDNYEHKNQNK